MNDKRFEMSDQSTVYRYSIIDNENGVLKVNECVILLNKLNDENEQLRKDCTILVQSNQEYRKENEQLRQQVQRCSL